MTQWCHRLFALRPSDDVQQARNSFTAVHVHAGLHIQFLAPHDLNPSCIYMHMHIKNCLQSS